MPRYVFILETQPERCPLPCDDCAVTVELTGDHSLHELAGILLDAIGFALDHAFGFHEDLAGPYGGSGARYTMFADMGEGGDDEQGVAATRVSDVFEEGRRMLFHFDYGDDWQFLVTCTHVEEARVLRKQCRVVSVEGTPPRQYPEWEGP